MILLLHIEHMYAIAQHRNLFLVDVNRQMEEERKERMRRRLTAHIPEALLGG